MRCPGSYLQAKIQSILLIKVLVGLYDRSDLALLDWRRYKRGRVYNFLSSWMSCVYGMRDECPNLLTAL
jgi:hypothetical protein